MRFAKALGSWLSEVGHVAGQGIHHVVDNDLTQGSHEFTGLTLGKINELLHPRGQFGEDDGANLHVPDQGTTLRHQLKTKLDKSRKIPGKFTD